MIETYAGLALAMVAFNWLTTWLGWTLPDSQARGWIQDLRGRHWVTREAVDGILISAGALAGTYYIHAILLPAVQAGGLVALAEGARLVIGVGLGLSIGRWLTTKEYRFWRTA